MPYVAFVACALAVLWSVLWPGWTAAATAPVAQAPRYAGPIVDTHAHLEAESGVGIDTFMALYDQTGVKGGWMMGVPWMLATEAWERYPDRVVPFLAEEYTETVGPQSVYRNHAALSDLLGGGYGRGLGEMILRHSAFSLAGGYSAGATNVPADHPSLLPTYAVAGRHGVPVVVHQEAAFAEELERAVRGAPDTRFVWAHAGHGSASLMRGMLARNANLYADLAARTPWLGPSTVLTRADGSLEPAWAALLAEYPDRFTIGLDMFAPQHYRLPYVRDTVEYYRGVLGRLDPTTAELIGYRNAERLAPFTSSR